MSRRERLMGAWGRSRAMARKAPRNRAPRVSPGVRNVLRKLDARPGPEGPKAFSSLDAMMRLRHSLARTRRPGAGTVR